MNNIKLLILDVDGVMTNGQITYDNNGNELKSFNVKDGLAIKQLQEAGIDVAIITARESAIVTKRAKELNIKYLYQNQPNKINAYQQLLTLLNLNSTEVAYLGDDWTDLPVLLEVGLPAIVQDAEPLLKQHAKFITTKNGGDGAVRELAYAILQAQNKLDSVIQKYYTPADKTNRVTITENHA